MVAINLKSTAAKLADLLPPKNSRLKYSTDREAGFRRVRAGRGFVYFDSRRRRIRSAAVLRRIGSLAIPPAWTDVWICHRANGHLQATGRDQRGRKQYRYHDHWRELRDQNKYDRLAEVAAVLPRLRRRVRFDLRRHGVCRERVLATIVQALETTYIRIGNDEYAKTNGTFGLTTMHNHHAKVVGNTVRFSFRGKCGKYRTVQCSNAQLAKIVKRCQDLPGRELFGYLDAAGKVRDVTSTDVNDYLREITGEHITAKDFRTWAGTLLAAKEFAKLLGAKSVRPTKRLLGSVVESVSQQLGNTKAICQKCYIHPVVMESFIDGSFEKSYRPANRLRAHFRGLRTEEVALLNLLQSHST